MNRARKTRERSQHAKFERLAVEEARKSISENDGRSHPFVGVVVVKDGEVLTTAHRGEIHGNHAEFIALETKLRHISIAGATVYCTLEPCTRRSHGKIPCALGLIERKVSHVYIGMLDPNPEISGKGLRMLREANIATSLFPERFMAEIEELNREFARTHKSVEVTASSAPPVTKQVVNTIREVDTRAVAIKVITSERGDSFLEVIGSNRLPYRLTMPNYVPPSEIRRHIISQLYSPGFEPNSAGLRVAKNPKGQV